MTTRKSGSSSAVAAPEGSPAGQLPDHLPRWLEAMNRRMSADLGAQVRGLGRFLDVRASERRILQMIPASEPIRITDLAALAGMTKQALGEFADRLERSGLVRSSKAPADGTGPARLKDRARGCGRPGNRPGHRGRREAVAGGDRRGGLRRHDVRDAAAWPGQFRPGMSGHRNPGLTIARWRRYVLRGGQRGYERLQLLARVHRPGTAELFLEAGIRPGMRVPRPGLRRR